MDGSGAAGGRVPPQGQDRAAQSVIDTGRHLLAPPPGRGVARHPGRARAVIYGSPALPALVQARRVAAPARGRAGREGVIGHGVPEGGRCPKKEATARQRDLREALGRSRGRYGTKACVIADGSGHTVAFAGAGPSARAAAGADATGPPAAAAEVSGGRPRLHQPRVLRAHLAARRASGDPAAAARSPSCLPALGLQQPQPG